MKTEYLYAIVNSDGECWRIVGRDPEKGALSDILAEGWRPVRETPFPPTNSEPCILICLEREPDGHKGFGFGP